MDMEKTWQDMNRDELEVVTRLGVVKALRVENYGPENEAIVAICAGDIFGGNTMVPISLDEARTYRALLDLAIGDEEAK